METIDKLVWDEEDCAVNYYLSLTRGERCYMMERMMK